MFFWDGVVEFLTDEIAFASSDADCETAVRTRVMVFKVGHQSGAVADAQDFELFVRYASVGLVIQCWCMLYAGRQASHDEDLIGAVS